MGMPSKSQSESALLTFPPIEQFREERVDGIGMSSSEQLASHILTSLQNCMRNSKGGIPKLFQPETLSVEGPNAAMGLLEPEEFLAGLIRLGIVEDGELSVESIIEAMPIINVNFDGRVSLAAISKA